MVVARAGREQAGGTGIDVLPVMSGFCSEPDKANSLAMMDCVRMNHV